MVRVAGGFARAVKVAGSRPPLGPKGALALRVSHRIAGIILGPRLNLVFSDRKAARCMKESSPLPSYHRHASMISRPRRASIHSEGIASKP